MLRYNEKREETLMAEYKVQLYWLIALGCLRFCMSTCRVFSFTRYLSKKKFNPQILIPTLFGKARQSIPLSSQVNQTGLVPNDHQLP